MKSYTNIEKSAFRKGEYVGYGGGRVWRIKRVGSYLKGHVWRAEPTTGRYRDDMIVARRLDEMSTALAAK